MKIEPTESSRGEADVWFRAAGAVTGVGSLPHDTPADAVSFVARHAPEVPFWPQLRRLSPRESMVPQTFGPALRYLTPVRGEHAYSVTANALDRFAEALEREAGRLEPANASGFAAFLEAVDTGAFPRARALKGQCMGPVTLACSLLAEGRPFITDPGLRTLLADYIVRLGRWQIDELQTRSRHVVLVLDEAYMGAALRGDPAGRETVTDLLRSVVLRLRRPGALIGLHCCDEVPAEILTAIEPDVYSFDAFRCGESLAANPHTHRFLANGGRLAWGWIPTLDDLSGVDAGAVAARWWEGCRPLVERGGGVSARRVLDHSLVTAACGLAGSSPATCERSFDLAREVASRFATMCEGEHDGE